MSDIIIILLLLVIVWLLLYHKINVNVRIELSKMYVPNVDDVKNYITSLESRIIYACKYAENKDDFKELVGFLERHKGIELAKEKRNVLCACKKIPKI